MSQLCVCVCGGANKYTQAVISEQMMTFTVSDIYQLLCDISTFFLNISSYFATRVAHLWNIFYVLSYILNNKDFKSYYQQFHSLSLAKTLNKVIIS